MSIPQGFYVNDLLLELTYPRKRIQANYETMAEFDNQHLIVIRLSAPLNLVIFVLAKIKNKKQNGNRLNEKTNNSRIKTALGERTKTNFIHTLAILIMTFDS